MGMDNGEGKHYRVVQSERKNKEKLSWTSKRVGVTLPHKYAKGEMGLGSLSSMRPDAGHYIADAISTTSILQKIRGAKRRKERYERSERIENVLYTA
jgi:hypothetical protein